MTVPKIAILKEIIAVHLTLLTKCFATVTLTPLQVSPHFADSYQLGCVNSTCIYLLAGFPEHTAYQEPLLFCACAPRALQRAHSNESETGK